MPDKAAAVLDAVLRRDVRSTFSAHSPGDWNIPLVDPDDEVMSRIAPAVFATPALGLTRAVASGRFGYASWSYLDPEAESLVVDEVRPLVEGRLSARQHLAHLQATTQRVPAPSVL